MGKKKRPTEWQAHGAIDSHAHLEKGTYQEDREAVLARAWHHGLSHIVLVAASDDPQVFHETVRLAATDERLSWVAGIHPHCAASQATLMPVLNEVLDQGGAVALGEIGLDFHYNFSPADVQREVFDRQLAMAAERELPVVLHIREAFEDALAILDAHGPTHRGIIHCFTGTAPEVAAYLARGFYISIPGIVTFGANAEPLRDAVREVPLDRLLVETDSPYLAPHPFRGRRNEPAYVAFVVDEVARCLGRSPEEVAAATARNTREVFGLGT